MDLCKLQRMNTGIGSCDGRLGTPRYIILVPDDAVVTELQAQDIITLLQENAKLPDPNQRWYPIIREISGVTNNSTEPVTATVGREVRQISTGNVIFLFEYWNRICSNRIIGKANAYEGGAYIIAEQPSKRLIGLEKEDGSLAPFHVIISVYGGGFDTTDGNENTRKMSVDFGIEDSFISAAAFFPFKKQDDLLSIKGFTDLNVRVVAKSAGVVTVKLVTDCNGVNVYDQYKAKFSVSTGLTVLWNIVDVSDGTAATITAITPNDTAKTFALNIGDGTFNIGLKPVDVLETNGVLGFEGVTAEGVVVPA